MSQLEEIQPDCDCYGQNCNAVPENRRHGWRGEVQNADSTATLLAAICPKADTLSQRLRTRRVGSDTCGGIKIHFNIVWRGAQISNVDHSALLCIFGAEHKTARRPVRRRKHPPNDQSPLGGV